jgi:hypothetical protein
MRNAASLHRLGVDNNLDSDIQIKIRVIFVPIR